MKNKSKLIIILGILLTSLLCGLAYRMYDINKMIEDKINTIQSDSIRTQIIKGQSAKLIQSAQ